MTARLTISKAYALGLTARFSRLQPKVNLLRHVAGFIKSPSRFAWALTPFGFNRWREFAYVFSQIGQCETPQTVLDVGSPKLLPVTMAHCMRSCEISTIDVVEGEIVEASRAAEVHKLSNLKAKLDDARQMSFPDDAFDVVTSVSVFEHIAPEVGGDAAAVEEVIRVLKPGGLFILTVPFATKAFAEYVSAPVYERPAEEDGKTFFQRFYDKNQLDAIYERVGRLDFVDVNFISQRHFSKSADLRWANFLSGTHWQRVLFGPWYGILSRVLLSPPRHLEQSKNPYIACLTLRKAVPVNARAAA